jgi:hypothetical protein
VFYTTISGVREWSDRDWIWTGIPWAKASRGHDLVNVVRLHPLRPGAWYTVTVPNSVWVTLTLSERRDFLMSFLRTKDEIREAADEVTGGHDAQFAADFPALHEYLTALKDPQGKRRQTATVTVSVCDGVWKASLNDRHTAHSLFVTAGSVQDAFLALEAVLVSPRPPWRPNPWQQGGNKGRGS